MNYHNYYCGCEVLSANFRFSIRTYFSILSVCVYYVCTSYLFAFLPSFIPVALAQFGMATQVSVYNLIVGYVTAFFVICPGVGEALHGAHLSQRILRNVQRIPQDVRHHIA
jgi:hypothetical protein